MYDEDDNLFLITIRVEIKLEYLALFIDWTSLNNRTHLAIN